MAAPLLLLPQPRTLPPPPRSVLGAPSTNRDPSPPRRGPLPPPVMARGNQLPRGQRDLSTNRPKHTRKTRPVEIQEFTEDGIAVAVEIPFYEVMPRARTERQLRWRRRLQKMGCYGEGTIVYPLTDLNGMGADAVQQFED